MKEFNYNVERTQDCVMVNVDDWVKPDSNKIQRFTITGKDPVTFITTAINTNLSEKFEGAILKGDTILLTKVVVGVAKCKPYEIGDNKRYFNVPCMQVIAVFKDNKVCYDNLVPLNDKIVFKKVDHAKSSLLLGSDTSTTIGEVLKVGTHRFNKSWEKRAMLTKPGDIVLIRDNVTTDFTINGETFGATEEGMVVGVFNSKDNLSLDTLTIINKNILMTPYKPEKVLNSNILVMPNIDYDNIDEASLDNQDQFKVVIYDKCLTEIKKGDIIFVNKDITNYVFFDGERYNIISGMDYVEGKLLER